MKEKLLIALAHAVKGYLTEPNSTKVIQRVLRTVQQHLHVSYLYVALQNKLNPGIEIKYSHGVPMSAVHEFKKKLDSTTIERIFYKDTFSVITAQSNSDDYLELKIDKDYKVCAACHIAYEGQVYGFLACYFEEDIELDIIAKTFITTAAAVCSAALEKEELLSIISELRQFDAESGIYSHQYFVSRLEKEMSSSLLLSCSLSIAIMSMDNFRQIVNLYGDDTVRLVLRIAAEELKNRIRGCDLLANHGIYEFILYMPKMGAKEAQTVIDDFNEHLSRMNFTDKKVKTSFSCGITQLRKDGDDLDSLIYRAQLALYRSRKAADKASSIEY